MKPQVDFEKELDALIGHYGHAPGERFWRRYGRWLARAAAAAALAAAAAFLVFFTLDKHVTDAKNAPAPKRPVTVEILPGPR
jgi:hypothetical protein